MRTTPLLLATLLLAGCLGSPPRPVDIALHDLGDVAEARLPVAVPLAGLRLRAAYWLDSPVQHYRLSYADATRRHAYAESRWIAPPAELLERHLQRRLAFAQPGAGPGCRLVLQLDELEQRFASPQSSQVVLEVRANLLPRHGEEPVARRAFALRQDAPAPDAKGGVRATRAAADMLAQDLTRWLAELARERPQAAAQCKESK